MTTLAGRRGPAAFGLVILAALALIAAASEPLRGILEYCDEPLVSTDFKGNPASSIFDSLSTMVLDGHLVKAISWYDNEWGYACRVGDLCTFLSNKGL